MSFRIISIRSAGRRNRGRVIEPASNRLSSLHGGTMIDVLVRGYGLGERHTDLGFSSSDNVCSSSLKCSGVPKMGAAREDVEVGIEQPRLPDNFSCVLHVGTQDETAGCGDTGFLQSFRPQYVSIPR